MEQYIVFTSNDEDFAIDISKVERIIDFKEPKKIPEASDYLLGVSQYNSRVIPIIDLNSRLYSTKTDFQLDTKIIVIMWKDRLIGLVVDKILGIRSFDEEQYKDSTEAAHILKEYVLGFIKEEEDNIIIVLNIEKIFDEKQEKELILATDR